VPQGSVLGPLLFVLCTAELAPLIAEYRQKFTLLKVLHFVKAINVIIALSLKIKIDLRKVTGQNVIFVPVPR